MSSVAARRRAKCVSTVVGTFALKTEPAIGLPVGVHRADSRGSPTTASISRATSPASCLRSTIRNNGRAWARSAAMASVIARAGQTSRHAQAMTRTSFRPCFFSARLRSPRKPRQSCRFKHLAHTKTTLRQGGRAARRVVIDTPDHGRQRSNGSHAWRKSPPKMCSLTPSVRIHHRSAQSGQCAFTHAALFMLRGSVARGTRLAAIVRMLHRS